MGGTPLPPFTDKIFGKKGVTDLGGTPPPPFTDKIRKVVFEVLPNTATSFLGPDLATTNSGEPTTISSSLLALEDFSFWDSNSSKGELQILLCGFCP